MKAKEIEQLALSNSETRDVITPYAFKIDQGLLGLPLAPPMRRILAITIDVALIFLAAKLSAALIAFVAAIAFYKGTAQQYLPKMSGLWRRVLKLLAASILFVCALMILSKAIEFFEQDTAIQGTNTEQELSLNDDERLKVLRYLEQTDEIQSCDEACQNYALKNILVQVPKLAELEELRNSLLVRTMLQVLVEASDPTIVDGDNEYVAESQQAKAEPSNSILQWGKGIIKDLGLGFGWAAVYFTLFSLLWRGQTPGKKICNIRVVALNGEPLSLLDCFGRYGGYGAGFATGLLGFMQIYWDPNRQAIQDKISSTVVIKGSLNQSVSAQTIADAVKD